MEAKLATLAEAHDMLVTPDDLVYSNGLGWAVEEV
jgi:hypothetical protein